MVEAAREYVEFWVRERELGRLQRMVDKKIAALVGLAPDLAVHWLKAPRKWPEEARPAHRWARLVLGEGAIGAVVKYLAKEVDQDRVAMKFDVFLKKNDHARIEILVAYFDTHAALLLRRPSLEPRQLSLLAVASGLQAADPAPEERERRRETWKARRGEADKWAAKFLKKRVVDEPYEKGFF